MTRADKEYYGHKFKTMFWSVFSLFIISWVGTNLVLCALTTNVQSNGDLIYEAPKDVYFISGPDFHSKYMNLSITSVTFDRYTNEINAKIAGVQGTEVAEGIMYYKVGNDLYFLSNDNIVANEDCNSMFVNSERVPSERLGNLQKIVFNNFDTKNVVDMTSLFRQAQNLKTIIGLEHFNTSKVRKMDGCFLGCRSLETLDLSGWDTNQVTSMSAMFGTCRGLKSIKGLEDLDVRNVEDFSALFSDTDNLKNLDLSKWQTTSATNFSTLFANCCAEVINVSGWDTSSVTDMSCTFSNVGCFSIIGLTSWDTSNVEYMGDIFYIAGKLDSLDLSSWNTSCVTDMYEMFYGAENLQTIYVSEWFDTTNVDVESANNMFYGCVNLVGENWTYYDESHIDLSYARIDDPDNDMPGYFTYKPYSGK